MTATSALPIVEATPSGDWIHTFLHLTHSQVQVARRCAKEAGFANKHDVAPGSVRASFLVDQTFPLTYMLRLEGGSEMAVRQVMSVANPMHSYNGVAKLHVDQEKDILVRRKWTKAVVQPFNCRGGSGSLEAAQALAHSVGRLRCHLTKPIAWRSQRIAYFLLRDEEAFVSWQVLARLAGFDAHHTVTVLDTLRHDG